MSSIRQTLALLTLTCMLPLSGCQMAGYAAHVAEELRPPDTILAEYRGLENQSVAVIVNADYATLYDHPVVQLEIATAVTRRLADQVPGIELVNPRRVVEFQVRNPYWSAATYSELAKRLNVSRIVLIDVQEFRTREPGDTNLFRGVISAHVSVATDQSNNLVYATTVSQAFPANAPEGILDARESDIRLGTISLFSYGVANKFADMQEAR